MIHIMIGFKHDVPCIVRSERGRSGQSDTSVREARNAPDFTVVFALSHRYIQRVSELIEPDFIIFGTE